LAGNRRALRRARDDDVHVPAPASASVRVLIVDDHARFRALARRTLQAEGYEVVGEAPDGAAALAAVAALHPDVVLLDVGLPDVSGLDLAQQLHDTNGGPQVVLVSTRDAEDYAQLAHAHGARGFVPKAELSGDALRAVLAQ
jgi:DNA-binding NarL/FixJ family response regulator